MRSSPNAAANSGFLTDAQRAALDAALAAKQNEGGSGKYEGRGGHPHHHASKGALLHDKHVTRKNASGKAREAKKGGGGGKYTWGSALQPVEPGAAALDKNDPNYDTDEEDPAWLESERSLQIKEYKHTVESLLDEYWAGGDIEAVVETLREMDLPEFDHFLVKKAVTLSMDRHDREREMTSVLLSALYSELISPDQMAKGFSALIEALEDLKLDVPDAVDQASNFVARAVVDDILPPSFIARVPADAEGSAAAELRHKCEVHLGARHAAERMLRCWGSGAGRQHSEIKEAVTKVLEEYVDSHDAAEAERCLATLAVPFFLHELVKQALHVAMDNPAEEDSICVLLKHLASIGRVSELQMSKGFGRVAKNLDDTALDNPAAGERFAKVVQRAKSEEWLEKEFETKAALAEGQANGNGGAIGAAAAGVFPVIGLQEYKTKAVAALKEYYASNDVDELAAVLKELGEPGLSHLVVKHFVALALDRKDREREMTSAALVALSPDVISADSMGAGFTRLLSGMEDLELDIPDAAHTMSLFLGRAVVDELLPPSFLQSCLPALRNNSAGVSVVKATAALLSARHAAERLQNCWHGGARTIEQLRESMQSLIKEYQCNNNAREAGRCLLELGVPHYHHEFVKRCLLAAFEAEDASAGVGAKVMDLLKNMDETGEINQTQMCMGFERVESELDDIALDAPHARSLFAQYKEDAIKQGWLVVSKAAA